MLSVTDAACVVTAADVYYYLNKGGWGWPTTGPKNCTEDHNTHLKISTDSDLRMSEPNDYKIFCCWMVHELMRYSILLPLQLLKEILTYKKLSLSVSIYPLQDAIWTMKWFWRHKTHKCHISSIHWNYCAGDVFTD